MFINNIIRYLQNHWSRKPVSCKKEKDVQLIGNISMFFIVRKTNLGAVICI